MTDVRFPAEADPQPGSDWWPAADSRYWSRAGVASHPKVPSPSTALPAHRLDSIPRQSPPESAEQLDSQFSLERYAESGCGQSGLECGFAALNWAARFVGSAGIPFSIFAETQRYLAREEALWHRSSAQPLQGYHPQGWFSSSCLTLVTRQFLPGYHLTRSAPLDPESRANSKATIIGNGSHWWVATHGPEGTTVLDTLSAARVFPSREVWESNLAGDLTLLEVVPGEDTASVQPQRDNPVMHPPLPRPMVRPPTPAPTNPTPRDSALPDSAQIQPDQETPQQATSHSTPPIVPRIPGVRRQGAE